MTSIFSPEQLDKIIAEHLPADAKPDEKIVVGALDQDGASVIAAFKFKPKANGFNWELQGAAHHGWDGDDKVGGKVLLRWG